MLRANRRVGPYRIERRIAAGGMAEVYVAVREGAHGFERRVALKSILPQLASEPEFAAMFIDEARLAARLEHPGIASVFDFGELDGSLYLAMELVDGASVNRTLRAAASRGETIPLAVIAHVGVHAARALAYAHHARDPWGNPLELVHRDVSPANILLGRRGEVKLVDFGIARCIHSLHHTDHGMVRGKLGYMSPEQVMAEPIDGRSDVFTLGAVLAEMCLGEPLFGTGDDLEILTRIRQVDLAPLDALSDSATVPPELVRLLRRALVREPRQRIEASHFADALEELADRRKLVGRGAREAARLLHRLGLLTPDAADVDAREPGARLTALVDTRENEPTSANPVDAPGTAELLATIALDAPSTYEIVDPRGRVIGPLAYADLVRRIVAGEVPPSHTVRREGTSDVEPPRELRRYLRSRALGWEETVTPGALVERGALAPGSLLSLAFELATRRRTGLLELVDAGWEGRRTRRKRIFFVEGKPDFVASNDPAELLGEYLVRTGQCMRMELEMALAVLERYDGRLGDALVGIGILRPMALARAIAAQVRERYLESFRWQQGQWTFVEGARADEERLALEQGPFELLRDAAMRVDGTLAVAALAPMTERVVHRTDPPPAPLHSFGVPAQWERALRSVDGRTPLSGLLLRAQRDHGLDVEEAHRVYCFGLACSLLHAA